MNRPPSATRGGGHRSRGPQGLSPLCRYALELPQGRQLSRRRLSPYARQIHHTRRRRLPRDCRRGSSGAGPIAQRLRTAAARTNARLATGEPGPVRVALHETMGLHPRAKSIKTCPLIVRKPTPSSPGRHRLPVGISNPPRWPNPLHLAEVLVDDWARAEANVCRFFDGGVLRRARRRRFSSGTRWRRAAEAIRAFERAGLPCRLRSLNEHLSSARSGGRPVRSCSSCSICIAPSG